MSLNLNGMYYFFASAAEANEFFLACPDKQGTKMDGKTVVKTTTESWWFKKRNLNTFLGYSPNVSDWISRMWELIPRYNTVLSQTGWKIEYIKKGGPGTSYVLSRDNQELVIHDLSPYLTMVGDEIVHGDEHLLAILQNA